MDNSRRVAPPESPVDALLPDLLLSSRESGIGIEQSTLRRGRCSTDGSSVTDAAPDGQPATRSATETLRPGGQPAAPGVTAVAAVQLFQGVTAPGRDSSRGSDSSRAASGARSDSTPDCGRQQPVSFNDYVEHRINFPEGESVPRWWVFQGVPCNSFSTARR